jgi:hypothetical protein
MLIEGAPADCMALCMRYMTWQKVGEGRSDSVGVMGCRRDVKWATLC